MSRAWYTGGCHCKSIRFRVRANLSTEKILDCNCSICEKKGILHLIVDANDFEILQAETQMSVYSFNTHKAVHRFCPKCGIHPFYTPRSHPDKIDVNVRCLDKVNRDSLNIVQFNGKNWEQHIDELNS